FPCKLAIHCLRPRILHAHADAAWAVAQCYCGCNLVDVLPARPGRSRKRFLKIVIANAEPRHALLNRIVCHCYLRLALCEVRFPQSEIRNPIIREHATTVGVETAD